MPITGPAFVLGGKPRLRIFSAISIGYGSVDSSDSSTDTSTSTMPFVLADSGSQRRERTQRGVTARDVLGDPRPGLHRRPAGIAVVDPARRRLHRQRRGDAVTERSVLTEIREMRTTTSPGRSACSVAASSPNPSSAPGGIPSTSSCDGAIRSRTREISPSRSIVAPRFPALRYSNRPERLLVGNAAGKRPPAAQRISGRRLDLGDVGTEVDEQLRAVRARDVAGDFDDAQPVQRARHAGIPMAFGSMYR